MPLYHISCTFFKLSHMPRFDDDAHDFAADIAAMMRDAAHAADIEYFTAHFATSTRLSLVRHRALRTYAMRPTTLYAPTADFFALAIISVIISTPLIAWAGRMQARPRRALMQPPTPRDAERHATFSARCQRPTPDTRAPRAY